MNNIHVGDIGTMLRYFIYDQNGSLIEDLDLADKVDIKITNPDGDVSTLPGNVTDSTGEVVYKTTIDDSDLFNMTGEYTVQITIHWPDGTRFSSNIETFRVDD
jgi:hypothetical protein